MEKKRSKATTTGGTAYISFESQYKPTATEPINPEISITDNALILSGYLILYPGFRMGFLFWNF